MRTMIVALAGLLLAGWLSAANAEPLRIWTPYQGVALEVLEEDARAFAGAFDLPVQVESLPLSEIRERLLAAGDGPAPAEVLFGLPHEQVHDLDSAELVADLAPTVTDAYLSDLTEPGLRAFRSRDRLLGYPVRVQGPALIFDRARVEQAPATLDELTALAVRLSGPDLAGWEHDATNLYYAYGWLVSFGGYLFAEGPEGRLDILDVGLANDGAVRGLEAMRDLRFQHGLLPELMGAAEIRDRFRRGQVAMIYDGPWAVSAARAFGRDVGVAPMPALPDGSPWRALVSVDGVAVPAGALRTEVVNLAKWLAREDLQATYARRADRVPASHRAIATIPAGDPIAGFARALLHADPVPTVPAMGRVWGPIEAALATVMEDQEADAAAALTRAVERIVPEGAP